MGFGGSRFWKAVIISKPGPSPRLYWHQDCMWWDDPRAYSDYSPMIFLMYYLDDTSRENGTATITDGEGYQVDADAVSASATLTPEPAMPMRPVVTITADAPSVTVGSRVSFTLTAAPAPAEPLTVNVKWSDPGEFRAASGPETVIIPVSGKAPLTAETDDDSDAEQDGSVTATVEPGSGYTVGSPSSDCVIVTDNEIPVTTTPGPTPTGPTTPGSAKPVVTVNGPSSVNSGGTITFTVSADAPPPTTLTVDLGYVWMLVTSSDGGPHEVKISDAGTGSVSVTATVTRSGGNGAVRAVIGEHPSYTRGSKYSHEVTVRG